MRINATATGRAGNYAKIVLVDQPFMNEVGDLAQSLIRRRTAAGKDADGVAFQELSPAYAKKKQKELGHSRPDLTVSGRMLNEMSRLKSTEKTVTIGFAGGGTGGSGDGRGSTLIQRSRSVAGADKALFHNVTGAGKSHVKRKFFGLTPDERNTIRDRVQAHVSRQVANR
jgi:phage gpG-like protein